MGHLDMAALTRRKFLSSQCWRPPSAKSMWLAISAACCDDVEYAKLSARPPSRKSPTPVAFRWRYITASSSRDGKNQLRMPLTDGLAHNALPLDCVADAYRTLASNPPGENPGVAAPTSELLTTGARPVAFDFRIPVK